MGVQSRRQTKTIHNMKSFAALLLVNTVLAAPGWHHRQYTPRVKAAPKAAPAPPTIAGLVVSDSRFSTLLAAVKAAGLVDTLSGAGPFTVFAPTNDAFAKVPQDALTAVLLRHLVPAAIKAKDVPMGSTTLGTAGGEEIVVTNGAGGVSIESSAGSANVIIFYVIASNGVVHAVDTVF